MLHTHKAIYSLLMMVLLVNTRLSAQTADLILTNGKIFTSDTAEPFVQALAIKGNTILATGSNATIEKLSNKKTRKIDLLGKTVVPGFNDAHDHPGWLAPIGKFFNKNAELVFAGLNKKAVLDSVAKMLQLARPGEWIHGFIGTNVFFDSTMRAALDSLAPNNPVELQIWWGHGIVVNGKALEASGLSDNNADPVGGWYIRAPVTNKIFGLQQNAQVPVWIALNKSDPGILITSLKSFANQQLAAGITSVQYMGTGFTAQMANDIFNKAKLPQRTRIIGWPGSTPHGRQISEWENISKNKSSLLSISGIKYVIDGTPGERNALKKQTSLEPGQHNGRLNYSLDTMRQILKEALQNKQQLMMHITADSSFELVLQLLQEAGNADVWRNKRVRIEHNCVGPISITQRKILKDYGILMMQTPKYCMGSPLRSLVEDGIIVGISPDGTTNPFLDIMMAATMASDPKENLSITQAVIAYTKTNAYAEFAEDTKGILKKGMLADLAVLSQDIFTIPVKSLPATHSSLTIIDGKIIYQQ